MLFSAQALLPHRLRIDSEKEISVSYPEGWSVAQPAENSWVILNVPADQQDTATPTVRVLIGYLERTDHADAVSQLAEYANESHTPSTFLAIGGWPGLQRVQLVTRPQPSQGRRFPDPKMVEITTAVAAGNLLVRLEARLPSDADQQLQDLVLAIGRSLMFGSVGDPAQVRQGLNKLQSPPRHSDIPQNSREEATAYSDVKGVGAGVPITAVPLNAASGAGAPIFPQVQLTNLGNNGELEVAVSNNGTNVVVVRQFGFITSNNGGNSFGSTGTFAFGDGDSSVAFAQSGTFYVSGLAGGLCPANNNCIEITWSTNNGQTFPAANLANGVACPNSGAGACSTDQGHIAADRSNAGLRNGDRVYLAFRDLSGSANVTCSPDSNATSGAANTWAPRLPLEAGSDFPRVAVGPDGFFYVVYVLGGNTGAGTIRIDKFNPCTTSAAQMTRVAGFPHTASTFTNIPDCQSGTPPANPGFPGLDRCNNGNILSSPTVTVDDTNANHVYVAWSTNTANNNNTVLNNENVMVADSTNGGVNWNDGPNPRPPVTINANVTSRRFMAWVCATGGSAFATWYDRRAATAMGATNDLTDYFAASAGLSAGNLVRNNDEFKISTTSDAQCTTWPNGPRSTLDSENCSVQPQLAGVCCSAPLVGTSCQAPALGGGRCDYSDCAGGGGVGACQCPTGQTCRTDGFQTNPKFGDYNGNACVLGRLYTVFASSVGQLVTGAPLNYFNSFVVASTPTTLTYTGATSADFHDPANLSARLTLSGTSSPVAGQTVTFTIGTQSCTGVTNASGVASCTIVLNQIPGPYTVTASFAGSGLFQASSASAPFTITKEETTTTYTGPKVIANGVNTTFSAVLKEDGVVPVPGRTITITLGTGATTQTCNGTTDASGTATCTILVNQPLGAGTVAANFAGDAFYLPSSDSATTILFAFLDHGAFVVGDQTALESVEFWGDDWSRVNALSGGPAPDSFKGFAASINTDPPACGDTWTTRPGNSSVPPATLPAFMGVVVSSSISMSGSTISGNVPEIIVVKTDAGYAPDPGHHGTGTVVAVYCQ
jgi:hypothetical protein